MERVSVRTHGSVQVGGLEVVLMENLKGNAVSIGTELKEKKEIYALTLVVAEHKAFLSKQSLNTWPILWFTVSQISTQRLEPSAQTRLCSI
jgi:hypothetical protein